jgi:hypothetical protein
VTHASNELPAPYHPGNMIRHWLQLNTHGMARRSSIRSEFERDAGRLPMFSVLISRIGVIERNTDSNSAVSCTNARYDAYDDADSASMAATNRASSAMGACATAVLPVASAAAETNASRLRRARSRSAYLAAMISPCSVNRRVPTTAPGGWARIAS